MRIERWIVPLLATVLGLSIAAPAAAYCRTTTVERSGGLPACEEAGIPLYWPEQCVGYRIHQGVLTQLELEQLAPLVARAFARWTNPGEVCLPSINVVPLAPAASGEVGWRENGPNSNLIVFLSDSWPREPGELERTTLTWNVETGEILDADMEINAVDNAFSIGEPSLDGFDLETVLTHGAGHFLGLAHSDQPQSMMVDVYVPGDPPQMTTDDAEGICAIYPDSGERATRTADGRDIRVTAEPCSFRDPDGECGPLDIANGCAIGRAAQGTAWPFVVATLVAPCIARRLRRARRRARANS